MELLTGWKNEAMETMNLDPVFLPLTLVFYIILHCFTQ